MKTLTQERLKELLDYDPDTGVFVWKAWRGGTAKAGSVAGALRTDGYRQIELNRRRYYGHRLAFLYMEGAFPPDCVDHINHKKADNRWDNLRHVTNQENQKHKAMQTDNTSGVTGVYWNKSLGKWKSHIRVDGKSIYLGITHDKDEAIRWRKAAEVKYGFSPYHGLPKEAFARLDKSHVEYSSESA